MNLKKRIAVFLCMVFVIPAMLQSVPGLTMESCAATTTDYSVANNCYGSYTLKNGSTTYGYGNDYLIIEVGQKVDLASMVYQCSYSPSYTQKYFDQISGEKYSSSKKTVASVTNSGVVTAKKTGKVTITMKYKNVVYKQNFEVQKQDITKNKKVKDINNRINKLWKTYKNKSINGSNLTKTYNEIMEVYQEAVSLNTKYVAKQSWTSWKKYPNIAKGGFVAKKDSRYHLVADCEKLYRLYKKTAQYACSSKNTILATVGAKAITTKTLVNNGKKMTVVLNHKLQPARVIGAFGFDSTDYSTITTKSKVTMRYAIYKGNGLTFKDFTKGERILEGTIKLTPGKDRFSTTLKQELAPGNYYVVFYKSSESGGFSFSTAFSK